MYIFSSSINSELQDWKHHVNCTVKILNKFHHLLNEKCISQEKWIEIKAENSKSRVE